MAIVTDARCASTAHLHVRAHMPAPDEPKYAPILPQPFAAVLGEFIASWAGTTGLLTMLLADLVKGKTQGPSDDVAGSLVLIGMDTRTQIGFVRSLGLARIGAKHEKNLAFLLDKLEKSKQQRDFFAHAMWSADDRGRLFAHSLKTVGKVRYVQRHVTSKTLVEEIASLTTTTGLLVKFFQKHGYLEGVKEWNGRFF